MALIDFFRDRSRPHIATLKKNRDVKGLVDALDCAHDAHIRIGAARALGDIRDANAVEALLFLLEDKNKRLQDQAFKSLMTIGKPAIEPLIRAFMHIKKAKKAPLPAELLREKLAELLGEIGDKRAAESLCAYLFEMDDSTGHIANSRSSRMTINAIRKIGEPAALNRLVEKLGSFEDRDRRRAVEILSRIGKLALEPLILSLKKEDAEGQAGAAEALGNIADSSAVEPLMQALEIAEPTPSNWFRIWMARGAMITALGKIGDKRAVGPVFKILFDTHINAYRFLAEDALANIGEPSVEPLVKSLDRESIAYWQKDYEHYRELVKSGTAYWCCPAANTLIKVGLPAVPRLLDALKDQKEAVRRAAAHALYRIGDERAQDALAAVLQNESEEFRQYVEIGKRFIKKQRD